MSKIDFCNDFAMDESDASLTVKQDCISLHFIINLSFFSFQTLNKSYQKDWRTYRRARV